VLFAVDSFAAYGQLSRPRSGRHARRRTRGSGAVQAQPGDFVLWKPSSDDLPGWDSPWGRGRPGWHIECSAMAEAHLGETIDIHAGGVDLQFPHHENEVAQSECAHGGKRFARWWLHNGMLVLGGAKMSKSVGNIEKVHDLVARIRPKRCAMRCFPRNIASRWTGRPRWSNSRSARSTACTARCATSPMSTPRQDPAGDRGRARRRPQHAAGPRRARRASPPMRARPKATMRRRDAKSALLGAGLALGLLQQAPADWFGRGAAEDDDARIQALIDERIAAKAARDFARADAIRKQLADDGILLEDTPQGVRWKRA
jgi:cysteinyl-tRNA synthetase